jgi:Trypsin-co-occurring domain 2
MAQLDVRATQLVRDAKAAIVHADRALKQYRLTISRVELELSVVASRSVGGGFSFELVGVGADVGADRDSQDTTTLHLSLVPDPEAAEPMGSAPTNSSRRSLRSRPRAPKQRARRRSSNSRTRP